MINKIRKCVCIFAHPDDESFGPSGTIAKLASQGQVFIICVTDGNDITNGNIVDLKGKRMKELKKSAKILGVKKVYFLDYKDGELRNNIYHEVAKKIEKILVKIKPDTLLTFEMRGMSGHIDHVFCSMITSFLFRKLKFVKTLLYFAIQKSISKKMKDYFIYFPPGFEENQVDLVVDVSDFWNLKLKAIINHKSQYKDRKQILKLIKKESKKEYFFVLEK